VVVRTEKVSEQRGGCCKGRKGREQGESDNKGRKGREFASTQ